MANQLLSQVEFGAYLCYSPRGNSAVSKRSREFRDAVKKCREATLQSVISRLAADIEEVELGDFLGDDVTLVPAPRSSPLVDGALWPSRRICNKLVENGLGGEVVPCLERTEAVPKSAYAAPGERPDAVKHFNTMNVDSQFISGDSITVVDDFITKGNTLLAGVSRVQEAYPDQDVRAFSLVRTMGLIPEIDEIVAPCTGTITESFGDANRDP